MGDQNKRRFILITAEPMMGNKLKGATGLLAGFPVQEGEETMFISLFKENNYYALSTRAYMITKVHYCVNHYEAIVYYNRGDNIEESKKEMKKSLTYATGILKKFVAAAGVDLKNGVLPAANLHLGYPDSKDIMRRVADTPSSTEKNIEGTPGNPVILRKGSKEKEESAAPSKPTPDWREPLWISRRSNQYTVKTAAEVKKELIKRIAEQAAKVVAGVREEEVGKDEESTEGYLHRAGTGRTIPSGSLCIACADKWECTMSIEYKKCALFKEQRMSIYPDGLL